MANEYSNAVENKEIISFANYIADGIVTYARKGYKNIRFVLLTKGNFINHAPNGVLDKYNPGPIPPNYVDRIIQRLEFTFPDIDIGVIKDHLCVSWE